MRILMVIDRYMPVWGGAENQLRQLLPHLIKKKCDCLIVTRKWKREWQRKTIVDQTEIYRVGICGKGIFSTLWYIVHLIYFIVYKRKTFDVIHTHGAAALGALACFAAIVSSHPVVVLIATAGKIPRLQRHFPGRLLLKLLRRACAITALSDEIRQEALSAGIASQKIRMISNGVNTDTYKPIPEKDKIDWRLKHGFTEKDVLIVFTGRLVYRKGVDLLLQCWPRVSDQQPNAHLVIVGDGAHQKDSVEKSLKTFVRDNKLLNVHFIGASNEVASWLGAADIFAFPSRKEGCPNSLLEAMASATPVIATNIGGASDLIISGDNGILVPADDSIALGNELIALIQNHQMRSRIAGAARSHILEHNTFEKISEQHYVLYKECLDRKGGI